MPHRYTSQNISKSAFLPFFDAYTPPCLQSDNIRSMRPSKTEEFYYLRLTSSSFSTLECPQSCHLDSLPQIISPYPSFLNIRQLDLPRRHSQIFWDNQTRAHSFWEITAKRPLTSLELQKCITLQYGQPSDRERNRYNLKLQEIMKRPSAKDQLFERMTIPSLNSSLKTEIIIIPSYQPISADSLAKMAEQGDSKITTDSHKYQTLPTEESISSMEHSQKFKRSTRLFPPKLQKKVKRAQTNTQPVLLDKSCDENRIPPSPSVLHKRRAWMKRSRLIPQPSCLPEQIDQPQTYEQLKHQAGQILYTFGMFLQLLLIIYLMHPAPKI